MFLYQSLANVRCIASELGHQEVSTVGCLIFKEVLVLFEHFKCVVILDVSDILVHLLFEIEFEALLVDNLEHAAFGLDCIVVEPFFSTKLDLNYLRTLQNFQAMQAFWVYYTNNFT